MFPYSHEEGTYAHLKWEDDVPEEVKQSRAEEIMALQQQISLELNEDKVGLTFQVIVDRKEDGNFVGRTRFDSPEVDGEVIFTSLRDLKPGDFVKVKILNAEDFDLIGVAVE